MSEFQDAQAEIIGASEESLFVRLANGKKFFVSLPKLKEKPTIGSIITFSYNSVSEDGIPGSARFVKIMDEKP